MFLTSIYFGFHALVLLARPMCILLLARVGVRALTIRARTSYLGYYLVVVVVPSTPSARRRSIQSGVFSSLAPSVPPAPAPPCPSSPFCPPAPPLRRPRPICPLRRRKTQPRSRAAPIAPPPHVPPDPNHTAPNRKEPPHPHTPTHTHTHARTRTHAPSPLPPPTPPHPIIPQFGCPPPP
jgi:hypothetical protein